MQIKGNIKPRTTGLCEGNSPVTGEFPVQRASYAENVFIWWRHHGNSKSVILEHMMRIKFIDISYEIVLM